MEMKLCVHVSFIVSMTNSTMALGTFPYNYLLHFPPLRGALASKYTDFSVFLKLSTISGNAEEVSAEGRVASTATVGRRERSTGKGRVAYESFVALVRISPAQTWRLCHHHAHQSAISTKARFSVGPAERRRQAGEE